jgi:murein DD-endopeptidase MepM/ murein hydrolase activator NlpD
VLLEQRDDARRRSLELGLGHALGSAGRVADVGQRGGDAVAAEVGGDDALAGLAEGVEQAREQQLELGPQIVGQVRLGGGGDLDCRGASGARSSSEPSGVRMALLLAAPSASARPSDPPARVKRRSTGAVRCSARCSTRSAREVQRLRTDFVPIRPRRAARAAFAHIVARMHPRHLVPLLATLVALSWAAPAGAAWHPPVSGPVVRGFDLGANPFEAGRHRGADLAAAPGTPVRAPCAGPVLVAGRVGTSGGVVTLRCGVWRVSQMPLAAIAVRRGASVDRGALLGTVAASRGHAGLHLGVRRDGTRFGYTDPLRFLTPDRATPPPPLGRAPRPARPPRGRAPRPISSPRPTDPVTRRAPRPDASWRPTDLVARRPAVPWPAWAGLALVLAGAGVRWRGRSSRPRAARVRIRPSRSVAR